MRINLTVDIRSDLETVFSWLASPEKAMAWMTSVGSTEILEQQPGMVGTRFRERVQSDEGAVDMEGTVTAFEPNRRIGFHIESRVNCVDVDYVLEQVGSQVRLRAVSNVRWKFPVNVFALVTGPAMKRAITAQSNQEFERLKELCESSGAATSS